MLYSFLFKAKHILQSQVLLIICSYFFHTKGLSNCIFFLWFVSIVTVVHVAFGIQYCLQYCWMAYGTAAWVFYPIYHRIINQYMKLSVIQAFFQFKIFLCLTHPLYDVQTNLIRALYLKNVHNPINFYVILKRLW